MFVTFKLPSVSGSTEAFIAKSESYWGSPLTQSLTQQIEHVINSFLYSRAFDRNSMVTVTACESVVLIEGSLKTVEFLKSVTSASKIVVEYSVELY
jgi:hypothetical protein